MNTQQLKKLFKCPRSAYWASFGLDAASSLPGELLKAVKSLFNEFDLQDLMDYDVVRDRLEELINEDLFQMEKEKELIFDINTNRINRIARYLTSKGMRVEDGDKVGIYKVDSENIEVKRDFIFKDRSGVMYSALLMFKPDFDGSVVPEKSIDLFLMSKVFPDTTPLILTLRGKSEGSDEFIPNSQICFLSLQPNDFLEKIEEKLRLPKGQQSPCNYDECQLCFYKNICKYDDIDTKLEPIGLRKKAVAEDFTKDQLSVINFKKGEARVIAGAGSGKTSVLVNRILKLVEDGVDPSEILAITFTEKGVKEIKKKLDIYLPDNLSIDNFNVYTFNGFGFNFLRKHYEYCGFKEMPDLIDESERVNVLTQILDSKDMVNGLNYAYPFMKIFKAKGAVVKMKDIIDFIKRRKPSTPHQLGLEMAEVSDLAKIACIDAKAQPPILDAGNLDLIMEIFYDYQQYLQDNNLVEYQDQINLVLKALEEDKTLAKEYYGKYKHIVLDEFQDTDEDQMTLIKKFLYKPGKNSSLMVCGDDAQSIFSFRDVDSRNIINFKNYFPKAKDLKMLENWRSTQEILNVCNNVMTWNTGSIAKKLISQRRGEKPTLMIGNINDCAKKIQELVEEGESLQDIAVLSRTRQECIDLHAMLDSMSIPNVVVISNDVTADNQVQAMIALAKFLDETNEEEQRLLEAGIWLRKTNHKEFDEAFVLNDYILENSQSLLIEFQQLENDKAKYEWFMNKVSNAFKIHSLALNEIFKREENASKSFSRICAFLVKLDSANIGLTVESDDALYDAVTISTIHAAKGREWKNVVVNFEKMHKVKSKTDKNGLTEYNPDTEEVRIAFVAVSRAKQNLYVYGKSDWIRICECTYSECNNR